MKLLEEVEALPPEQLHTYIRERAERIVRDTQGESWDDPEDWLTHAVELAHAMMRIMREADEMLRSPGKAAGRN